ncbi:hypothetical protein SteCoe_21099 [Stentor coeruleus]|uniref:Uncharacterized protein n=1 Tax=Stentor coeruleus TaxID=5963 RepID=A0A1R2BQ97_9CILI|nr:hypothetical protein SteCoe_21099 [Stentor coeruleus]
MSFSYKSVKIKRRPTEKDVFDDDPELDYVLEKEGDITNFLKSKYKISCPKYNEFGELISHSIIGPKSLYKTVNKDFQSSVKKSGSNIKKKKKEGEINPNIRFKEILNQISELKNSSISDNPNSTSKISNNIMFPVNRQSIVLKNFQKTVNYWKSLEKNLATKNKRNTKEVLYTRSSSYYSTSKTPDKNRNGGSCIDNKLLWYMKLREDIDADKYETFLPVGSQQGGLYTRIQLKNTSKSPSLYKTSNEKINNEEMINLSEDDLDALQIIGVSKLPLEIAAVDKVGCQYLRPELLDLNKDEEVIEEHYDRKSKSRLS